jgi:hypothetical protein
LAAVGGLNEAAEDLRRWERKLRAAPERLEKASSGMKWEGRGAEDFRGPVRTRTGELVQFTPDLLPSDITGSSIWDAKRSAFEFRPGGCSPTWCSGDEINRASPKTQSALLEVMEEQQVTVDAFAHRVSDPFMVIATQNPVDLASTYALPEAQLDASCCVRPSATRTPTSRRTC